eukprot:5672989-Lingulodinium_polyedra.AAC.1
MAPRGMGSTTASRQSSGPQTAGAPQSWPAAASRSSWSAVREPHALNVRVARASTSCPRTPGCRP